MDHLHVATLNIRNLADRWVERLPLLLADMAALQPDLLGLQEVVYVMQQDRLIGAAGEGRYGVVRGWAGRPEYGNSLLVREPLLADGHRSAGPRARPLRAALGRRPCRAARRSSSSSRTSTTSPRTRPSATSRRQPSCRGSTDAPAADATIVMGDFNADPAEPAPARLREAGFRVGLRDGQRRRARGHLAVGAPGAGDGHRRAARVPRLHLGPRRRSGPLRAARASTVRIPTTPGSIRATTWASPHTSRSGRGAMAARTLRLAHRGDWRTAPENTLAAFAAALAVPACDGLEFDVRVSADGVPVICHDATLERTHGRPDRVDALTADALEALGVPTLADVLAPAGRRPVPRRRAQGRSGSDASSRCWPAGRGPGLVERGRLIVRGGRARAGRPPRAVVAALAQHRTR